MRATTDLSHRLSLMAGAGPVLAGAVSLLVVRQAPGGAGLCVAAGAAGLMAAAAPFVIARALRPLHLLRTRLTGVATAAADTHRFAAAQAKLDENLRILRDALGAHGEARLEGERLYFGPHLVNNDFTAVDQVRARAGGNATVFVGDVRISTNVTDAGGARAIGTRLAAGPARDRVLGEGRTYRGEADVLGHPCFTIYDPILAEGLVVGILFVGVRKADFAEATAHMQPAQTAPGDLVGGFGAATSALQAAVDGQAKLDREALAARLADDDARRGQERQRQVAAAGQRQVVARLSTALARLSAGELDCALTEAFPDDYARLRDDFNAAVAALRDTVESLSEAATGVEGGAGEISRASDDLSHRAEQQAAGLEETAAALDQITANVRMTAEGAQRAGQAVRAVRDDAQASGESARKAVSAMAAIAESSQKIGGIVGVMDEIAFQTTLLALNAGVEAARAGEAGRGFAVVASEVRALAQRSATAAKEIKALMGEAAREVDIGVDSVGEAGRALERIATEVAQVDHTVAEIAAGAREQATGLQQVNTAVNRIDQITQQNAAVAEQSTAAARALASEAEALSALAARFDLGGPQAAPALRRAA